MTKSKRDKKHSVYVSVLLRDDAGHLFIDDQPVVINKKKLIGQFMDSGMTVHLLSRTTQVANAGYIKGKDSHKFGMGLRTHKACIIKVAEFSKKSQALKYEHYLKRKHGIVNGTCDDKHLTMAHNPGYKYIDENNKPVKINPSLIRVDKSINDQVLGKECSKINRSDIPKINWEPKTTKDHLLYVAAAYLTSDHEWVVGNSGRNGKVRDKIIGKSQLKSVFEKYCYFNDIPYSPKELSEALDLLEGAYLKQLENKAEMCRTEGFVNFNLNNYFSKVVIFGWCSSIRRNLDMNAVEELDDEKKLSRLHDLEMGRRLAAKRSRLHSPCLDNDMIERIHEEYEFEFVDEIPDVIPTKTLPSKKGKRQHV